MSPLHQPSRLGRPVRGVLFDMCNVLYDATAWRRWLLRQLSRLGLHANYHSFFRVWDREYLDTVHRGERTFREAFEAFLHSAGLSGGQIDEVRIAACTHRRQLQSTARPLPGVKTTLGRLHATGRTLGVVSDCEHSAQVLNGRLERSSLDRIISTVVSSFDLRHTMPEAICYRTAVGAMGLPAAEVAFVGHDAIQLQGAAAVGMPTVAFNYDLDAKADAYIGRFEELIEAVTIQPQRAAG